MNSVRLDSAFFSSYRRNRSVVNVKRRERFRRRKHSKKQREHPELKRSIFHCVLRMEFRNNKFHIRIRAFLLGQYRFLPLILIREQLHRNHSELPLWRVLPIRTKHGNHINYHAHHEFIPLLHKWTHATCRDGIRLVAQRRTHLRTSKCDIFLLANEHRKNNYPRTHTATHKITIERVSTRLLHHAKPNQIWKLNHHLNLRY